MVINVLTGIGCTLMITKLSSVNLTRKKPNLALKHDFSVRKAF
jgi:hypothetical protein